MRWQSAPEIFEPPAEILEMLNLVQAARWLGVAPWDLARQPVTWHDLSILSMKLEVNRSAARRQAE